MGDTVQGSSTGASRQGREAGGQGSLADQLAGIARSLQGQDDVDATLDAMVHAAAVAVPGAQQVSLSAIARRREVVTRAATSELSRAVDRAQYDTGQGPCLDTLYDQQTVRLPDLRAEQRWPGFTHRVVELGVGSMLSVQLFVAGDDLGALNLLSEQPHAFDEESEHVALLFAAHAAVAMAGVQQQEQMRQALDSRDVIGQAKGILMERYKLTGDVAFRVLVRSSQHTNRKLQDIARELADTGQLPELTGQDDQPAAGADRGARPG